MSRQTDLEKRAVVLLSGGLDSTTVAAIAKSEGFVLTALSFDYGQRHRVELDACDAVVEHLKIEDHRRVQLDLRAVGGSALTDSIDVPKAGPKDGIPVTYVPARNTIFLSVALGLAETCSAFDIFFGANIMDYSGYPDCRPAFVSAFEALANVATKAAVENEGRYTIHAPLMNMSKAEIVKRGALLGVDYGLTHSCYDPQGALACGQCDSCVLRRRGFQEAGVVDPTRYAG